MSAHNHTSQPAKAGQQELDGRTYSLQQQQHDAYYATRQSCYQLARALLACMHACMHAVTEL